MKRLMRKAFQLRAVVTTLALLGGAPRVAFAQISGPWPPTFGAYWWQGTNRGDGDGDTGVWNNWDGRWQVDTPPPPVVITTLPAQDGDTLILDNSFVGDNDHHNVSFGSHNLPSSGMGVYLNATYTGGSLNLLGLLFENSGNAHGPLDPYPMNVVGTTMSVDSFRVDARGEAITFDGRRSTAIARGSAGTSPSAIRCRSANE